MVSILKKYGLIGLSALLMLLIAGEQISNPSSLWQDESTVNQQETNDQKDQSPVNSSDFSFTTVKAIVPLFNPDISVNLYLVHELNLLCEFSFNFFIEKPLYTSSYFYTLFRLIIAPNAP